LGERELKIIVVLEARTRQRHRDYAESKGWPRGEGIPLIEGLWRRRVKGCRGATPKPGSMNEYIRENGLLPSNEIDRLIASTPTAPLTQADFNRLGFNNWQDWLEAICSPLRFGGNGEQLVLQLA
jgi:hypothetical protein